MGEFVDRVDPSGDGEPAVAHVDVVELDGADGAGAGGVDRGEHEHQPGCRGRGGSGGLVDVVLAEALGDAVGVLAGLDAPGRVPEDRPLLLAEREQRSQGDQDVGSA